MNKLTKASIITGFITLSMLTANAQICQEPTKHVSDSGATLALLGIGVLGLMAIKRKLTSKK